MAILPVKKIHIFGHKRDERELVNFLYRLGVIEIIEAGFDMDKSHPDTDIPMLDKKLSEISYALGCLEKFTDKNGKNIVVDKKKYEKTVSCFKHAEIFSICKGAEETIAELRSSKEKLLQLKEQLMPWTRLDADMAAMQDTETYNISAGSINTKALKNFNRDILKENIFVEQVSKDKKNAYFVLLYMKEKTGVVTEILRKHKFSRGIFPAEKIKVSAHIENIYAELRTIGMKIENCKNRIMEKLLFVQDLMIAHDHYYNLKIKNTGYNFISETKETFYICGWVVTKKIDDIKAAIEKKFPETAIYFTEPLATDDIPVFLQNNKVSEPFNFVTELYGHPVYNGIDPSPLMAPFFVIFFGFCLTDAAYGIILTLISMFVLKKYRLKKEMSKFFKLMFYCGIFTIILGAVTGGWFGDLPNRLPAGLVFLKNFKNTLIFEKINPATQPLNFLIFALILGSIQLLFGLAVNFYYQLKSGNRFFAFFQQLPTILIQIVLLALILLAAGVFSLGRFSYPILFSVLGLSIISIAYTQWRINKAVGEKIFWSIFTNYGIVTGNFLADTLSYARLFALGLATGLMAMAVNEIAIMMLGLPYYIGIIPMLVFFIGGHAFNIIINMLGAYVHTSRLQYLEFFSKFYVAGGRVFRPFGESRKYTLIENV